MTLNLDGEDYDDSIVPIAHAVSVPMEMNRSGDIEEGGTGISFHAFKVKKKSKDDKIGLVTTKLPSNGFITLKCVTAGGVADLSGLKPGMKILTVNGQRASDVKLVDLGAGTHTFIVGFEQADSTLDVLTVKKKYNDEQYYILFLNY